MSSNASSKSKYYCSLEFRCHVETIFCGNVLVTRDDPLFRLVHHLSVSNPRTVTVGALLSVQETDLRYHGQPFSGRGRPTEEGSCRSGHHPRHPVVPLRAVPKENPRATTAEDARSIGMCRFINITSQ